MKVKLSEIKTVAPGKLKRNKEATVNEFIRLTEDALSRLNQMKKGE